MNDNKQLKILDPTILLRLAAYAVVAGVMAALATTFAFLEWPQDGTGAKLAVIGGLLGLVYAILTRKT